jgi:hypothetical protein
MGDSVAEEPLMTIGESCAPELHDLEAPLWEDVSVELAGVDEGTSMEQGTHVEASGQKRVRVTRGTVTMDGAASSSIFIETKTTTSTTTTNNSQLYASPCLALPRLPSNRWGLELDS